MTCTVTLRNLTLIDDFLALEAPILTSNFFWNASHLFCHMAWWRFWRKFWFRCFLPSEIVNGTTPQITHLRQQIPVHQEQNVQTRVSHSKHFLLTINYAVDLSIRNEKIDSNIIVLVGDKLWYSFVPTSRMHSGRWWWSSKLLVHSLWQQMFRPSSIGINLFFHKIKLSEFLPAK